MFGMNFDCGCAQWSGTSFVPWCWVRDGGSCAYATPNQAFTDHAWRPCLESPDGNTGSSRWGYKAYALQAVDAVDFAAPPPPARHHLGLEAASPNSSLHARGPLANTRDQMPPQSRVASFVAGILLTFSSACIMLALLRRWQRHQQRVIMAEAHDERVLSGVRGVDRVHFDEQQMMMMLPDHRRVSELVHASSAADSIAGVK